MDNDSIHADVNYKGPGKLMNLILVQLSILKGAIFMNNCVVIQTEKHILYFKDAFPKLESNSICNEKIESRPTDQTPQF